MGGYCTKHLCFHKTNHSAGTKYQLSIHQIHQARQSTLPTKGSAMIVGVCAQGSIAEGEGRGQMASLLCES